MIIPMTLSDFQGHAPNVGFSICSYSCATGHKISNYIERRPVSLRQLSLLCTDIL